MQGFQAAIILMVTQGMDLVYLIHHVVLVGKRSLKKKLQISIISIYFNVANLEVLSCMEEGFMPYLFVPEHLS